MMAWLIGVRMSVGLTGDAAGDGVTVGDEVGVAEGIPVGVSDGEGEAGVVVGLEVDVIVGDGVTVGRTMDAGTVDKVLAGLGALAHAVRSIKQHNPAIHTLPRFTSFSTLGHRVSHLRSLEYKIYVAPESVRQIIP